MNTTILGVDATTAAIAAVIVIVVIVALALFIRSRRSDKLRSRFGPEYSRVIEATGDKRHAEAELNERAKRVHKFDIRPLPVADRERYVESWRAVQARFVDDPRDAVARADTLLGEVMGARGYPVADFEQRAADLSVDHPVVVQNYRAAHDIAVRHERGEASTEDLRQAMVHYRALFDEIVSEGLPAAGAEQADTTKRAVR
ncbi:MAG: hypothetical protein ACYC8V_02775 [Caulobacteraceae bacterium]